MERCEGLDKLGMSVMTKGEVHICLMVDYFSAVVNYEIILFNTPQTSLLSPSSVRSIVSFLCSDRSVFNRHG